MKIKDKAIFINEGRKARENNQPQDSNPYQGKFPFSLTQRLFYSKLAKASFSKEANELWNKGWDIADAELALVNKRIQLNESKKAAQETFARECIKDHERLTFLLNHYLKRNGGYIDLQILAAIKLEFGDSQHLDIAKFKHWLDNEMVKYHDQERRTTS